MSSFSPQPFLYGMGEQPLMTLCLQPEGLTSYLCAREKERRERRCFLLPRYLLESMG